MAGCFLITIPKGWEGNPELKQSEPSLGHLSLSYVASLLPPNKDALKAENRALQTLCRGPWNAIPPSLLKSVKQIGMPTQATDLTVLSIASKIRVAHETSQKIFHMNSEINKIYDGFDIVLIYLDYKLANTTCIKSICNAYDSFRSSPDGNSINSGVFPRRRSIRSYLAERHLSISIPLSLSKPIES